LVCENAISLVNNSPSIIQDEHGRDTMLDILSLKALILIRLNAY